MTVHTSVVVAAYNSDRYIADALESVLDQTVAPDEVVVVDDGSTDASAEVVERFTSRVRLLRAPHEGFAHATNRGIAAARGALVAFQDADDLWLPTKLEHQLAALDADAALDAVSGRLESFLSPDLPPGLAARYRVPPVMPSYQLQSMLIRRSALDRVGPIDPAAGTGVLLDWISRSREAGLRTRVLDEVVVRRRIHETNLGVRDAAAVRPDLLRALRRHRRRTRDPWDRNWE